MLFITFARSFNAFKHHNEDASYLYCIEIRFCINQYILFSIVTHLRFNIYGCLLITITRESCLQCIFFEIPISYLEGMRIHTQMIGVWYISKFGNKCVRMMKNDKSRWMLKIFLNIFFAHCSMVKFMRINVKFVTFYFQSSFTHISLKLKIIV